MCYSFRKCRAIRSLKRMHITEMDVCFEGQSFYTSMRVHHFYIHNTNAPELIEFFLIAGVVSVLGIRAFLAASGYPQIGGAGLHIAHMLWGGLFMMLALLLLFMSLGHVAQRFAAILAGVGFGTFIDELGKFITSDNDYFYQPTIGLIYIVFIAIFLTLNALRRRESVSPDAALANALNRLELAGSGRLDSETKQETLDLLRMADPANPLVPALRSYVENAPEQGRADMNLYFRVRDALFRLYGHVALHRWFTPALIALFVIFAIVQVIVAVGLIVLAFVVDLSELDLSFGDWASVGSSSVSAVLVAIGIRRLRRSRASAYRWFQRAVLVSIFVTQVFAFFATEFAALGGLAIDILIYFALTLMIEREQRASLETDGE